MQQVLRLHEIVKRSHSELQLSQPVPMLQRLLVCLAVRLVGEQRIRWLTLFNELAKE